MGAEALTDWLHGFLSKPDIDLLLDPAKKLSADFLEDIAKSAEKKRTVLLLDTFEQLSALEDVMHELDHAVRSLAKAYGMPMHEVTEDLGPPRKRTRPPTTTRLLVLDDRPEFRFPDATDAGRAASETSDEEDEADDEDAGKQRRHKSRHRAVSKRHLGAVFGPQRWQR